MCIFFNIWDFLPIFAHTYFNVTFYYSDIRRVKPYNYTGKLSIKYYNVTTNTQARNRLGNIQLSIERGEKVVDLFLVYTDKGYYC